jgi:hypothetical protein
MGFQPVFFGTIEPRFRSFGSSGMYKDQGLKPRPTWFQDLVPELRLPRQC